MLFRYSGYCPQFRFSCGETYAKATHKLLLDPTINHASTLVLANRADDYEAWRPFKSDINVVNTRFKRIDPLFVHPMVPGYEGFVPGTYAGLGQRYAVRATEGLADFERQQLRNKAVSDRLRRTVAVQCGQAEPRNLEERLLIKSQFKLPLLTVRREYAAAMSDSSLDKKCETSKSYTSLFHYFVIKGYAIHIPHGYVSSGTLIVPSSDNVLCSVANCRKRQSRKYRVMTNVYPDPSLLAQSTEIYHENVGMIPNYLGYIPGAIFRQV
ncbi:PREDICTED: UPF0605 protein CG18335-like [Vollenhovia emeryi]|uniref:UPF0605 protein CG18335-like n=1 Tax=Vollenhovia emeryi TaxID=411798 RepID=UPI0005F3CFC6|nr:PREDICTED: UPF0605 protein CG18335-like [Vollenhovia emeryi]